MAEKTKTLTFCGPDGYAGFRWGQEYVLHYKELEDGQVLMKMNHLARGQASPHAISAERFAEYFVSHE